MVFSLDIPVFDQQRVTFEADDDGSRFLGVPRSKRNAGSPKAALNDGAHPCKTVGFVEDCGSQLACKFPPLSFSCLFEHPFVNASAVRAGRLFKSLASQPED